MLSVNPQEIAIDIAMPKQKHLQIMVWYEYKLIKTGCLLNTIIWESYWRQFPTDLANALAMNRRQAVTQTNGDTFIWRMYDSIDHKPRTVKKWNVLISRIHIQGRMCNFLPTTHILWKNCTYNEESRTRNFVFLYFFCIASGFNL